MKKEAFVSALRLRMKERKETQMAVSQITGVPQTAISRLLRGMNIGTGFTLALLEYLEPVSGTEKAEGSTDGKR